MTLQRSMLITSGPTHEAIDDVRYVGNRSSGRMGVALAEAARDLSWDVTLLLGPVTVPPPDAVDTVRFTSTADLQTLLDARFSRCDVLIMAAAVSDYRPVRTQAGKMPRADTNLVVELEPTPDLVAQCAERRRAGQRIVGFALEEPDKLEERALEKLRRKKLDALVANPLATMGSEKVRARLFIPDGSVIAPPEPAQEDGSLSKKDFARWLIEWIDGVFFDR